MSPEDLTEWSRRLMADHDALRPWQSFVPPFGMTPDQAYALQGEVARLREARGERIIGYKIGCTSRAIREQLGIREPIFGRLFDTGCFPSGSHLDHARFARPAIEGELAIRLSRDLPREPFSDEDYDGAVESIFPVIELHHYFLPSQGRPLIGLIASGGMHAGFVLPERERPRPGEIPHIQGLAVDINDRRVGTTAEPWTMGGPASTLRWLSTRLAECGLSLRPGQVILTGSALPLFPVGPGTRTTVEAHPLGRSLVEID